MAAQLGSLGFGGSGGAGKRLVVLGGGVSGLSFLHYLRNFAAALNKGDLISKVTLLEANNYMGGSIKSNVYEDGMIHELGPRSVRIGGVRSHNTVTLLEQLGLTDQILTVNDKSSAGKNRYIYNKGQLTRVPLSMGKLFARMPNSKATLASAMYRDFFKAPKMNLDSYPERDPPLYDFFGHRFGEEVAENVLDPVLRGITAGDCRKLSTRALFGELLEKEQLYGSIVKGMFKPPITKMAHDDLFPHDILESKLLDKFQKEKVLSYNLSSGLQMLPERLSNSLLNTNQDGLISIYNQTKVVSIQFNDTNILNEDYDQPPPCFVEVKTVDGHNIKIAADHIISTIPAKDLAKLLPESMPLEQRQIFDNILKIPHSPVGCVSVEYRGIEKKNLPKVIDSFGFLTHSKAGSRVLGISFDSSMFPQIDKPFGSTRMTCMIGGSWFKEMVGTDNLDQVTDAQLEQIALEEIRRILKINDEPHRMASLLWKTGIAQYTPGHKERLERTRAKIKELAMPITLLGQSYDGVAVNDVIFAARMAANNLLKSL